MNTRGLVELVVLNAGLDLGVLSPALFTMMALMALVTHIHDYADPNRHEDPATPALKT